MLRRTRVANRPKDPATLQELNIDGAWMLTTGDAPTRFLKFDNGQDADERVIVFATEQHLLKLSSCDVWCMDGTFSVAPNLFHQLYVIQGLYNGVFLPFVYCFLQRKTQSTYEILLQVLETAGCDPSVVIVDFERAVERALHTVFGDHVHIQYCFYHLTQSIWKKIQALGLSNSYQNDEEFRLFCGAIDALAFLPVNEVSEGMNHLKETCPDEAKPLLEYFDQTYVTGHLRQRQSPDGLRVIVRRTPPMFLPKNWNMHDVTVSDQPRTNNISEGWNNKFKALVGYTHPSIWKVIECLQGECARVTRVILQDERGIRPVKRVHKVYRELQSRLEHLCEDRISGRKSIPEFLRGVSHNLRSGQPNV